MKAIAVAGILSLCLAGYAKASCGEENAQCGGIDYVGETCCVAGTECVYVSEWLSECLPTTTEAIEIDDEITLEDSDTDSAAEEVVIDSEVDVEEEEEVEDSDFEVDSETESTFPRGQGMQFFFQCKNPKHWAMTYDDGPTEYTDIMLDLFNKYHLKVTFFVCGNLHLNINDPEWTRIVQRMDREGHLIGNHTYDHINLNGLTPEEITVQMKKVEDAIYQAIGKRPAFMRLPYGDGASNPTVMEALADNGYNAAINWNVDTMDWGNVGNIDYAKQVITEQLGNPIITLNHLYFDGITHENIVALASAEIEYLLSEGYTPVRMDECLGMAPYQEE